MHATRLLIAALLAGTPALLVVAQDDADRAARDAAQPSDTAAGTDEDKRADEVTIGESGSDQDPLDGKQPAKAVDPESGPEARQVNGVSGVPALRMKIDPRVLGVAPGEPLPPLRREGEAIRKRDGRLLPTGDRGYAVFILDADPEAGDARPLGMVVAPCLTLESMERMLEDRGEDLRFTITGEVHTYRGVNFLLPTAQPRPWLVKRDPKAEQADADQKSKPGEGDTKAEKTDTADKPEEEKTKQDKPAADKADNASNKEDKQGAEDKGGEKADDKAPPTADEVLDDLLKDRTDAPSTGGKQKQGTAPSKRPASSSQLLTDPLLLGLDSDQPQAKLKKEGEFIIARTGRLVRSANGAHALFVLDSDKKGAPEPPMIVQACKLLETMEKTVREQGEDVPFVITGQVFIYRGANYLLPTIVKREFERGNLE